MGNLPLPQRGHRRQQPSQHPPVPPGNLPAPLTTPQHPTPCLHVGWGLRARWVGSPHPGVVLVCSLSQPPTCLQCLPAHGAPMGGVRAMGTLKYSKRTPEPQAGSCQGKREGGLCPAAIHEVRATPGEGHLCHLNTQAHVGMHEHGNPGHPPGHMSMHAWTQVPCSCTHEALQPCRPRDTRTKPRDTAVAQPMPGGVLMVPSPLGNSSRFRPSPWLCQAEESGSTARHSWAQLLGPSSHRAFPEGGSLSSGGCPGCQSAPGF